MSLLFAAQCSESSQIGGAAGSIVNYCVTLVLYFLQTRRHNHFRIFFYPFYLLIYYYQTSSIIDTLLEMNA